MAKLTDVLDFGSSGETGGSSTLPIRTIFYAACGFFSLLFGGCCVLQSTGSVDSASRAAVRVDLVVARAMSDGVVRIVPGQVIAIEFPPRSVAWQPSFSSDVIELIEIPADVVGLERPQSFWCFRAAAVGATALVFHERITPDQHQLPLPQRPIRQIEYDVEVFP